LRIGNGPMSASAGREIDPRFLVRVEVPTRVDGKRDGAGKHGTTGTGYPVGRDLILTARHVVQPAHRDGSYRIRARWMQFPDFGREGAVELAPDEEAVVWKGNGEHDDLILLRCPERPPEVVVPAWPWAPLPRWNMPFKSLGYPRATRLEDPSGVERAPRQNAFSGEIRTSAEPWFEIVDSAAPKDAEGWKGASGMPIFTAEGIAGVFSAALSEVRGKGHCIPVAPLLERAPELVRLFDEDRFAAHWSAFRQREARKVASTLGKSERLRGLLVARLLDAGVCPELDHGPVESAATAAGCLLDLAFETFTGIAVELHRQLRDAVADKGPEARDERTALEALVTLTLHLAPMLYDAELARTAYVSSRRAQLLELPAALYSVAELMVAAEEGRAAAYQHRKGPTDNDPRGIACLSAAVPELGLDATQEDYSERFLHHLGRKEFTAEAFEGELFLKDCERFLMRFYPPGRPVRGASGEERAADKWRGMDFGIGSWTDRSGSPVRLYTVFRPESAQELGRMRTTAENLHERYPSLRILFLTAFCQDGEADNPWDREMAKLKGFCQILPFRGAGPEASPQ
jgi:hypothetical protein